MPEWTNISIFERFFSFFKTFGSFQRTRELVKAVTKQLFWKNLDFSFNKMAWRESKLFRFQFLRTFWVIRGLASIGDVSGSFTTQLFHWQFRREKLKKKRIWWSKQNWKEQRPSVRPLWPWASHSFEISASSRQSLFALDAQILTFPLLWGDIIRKGHCFGKAELLYRPPPCNLKELIFYSTLSIPCTEKLNFFSWNVGTKWTK